MGLTITCDIIKVLREVETHTDHKWQIRIVRWCGGDPVLEKRQFMRKDGEWRTLKVKGLTGEDLEFITEHANNILGLLDT